MSILYPLNFTGQVLLHIKDPFYGAVGGLLCGGLFDRFFSPQEFPPGHFPDIPYFVTERFRNDRGDFDHKQLIYLSRFFPLIGGGLGWISSIYKVYKKEFGGISQNSSRALSSLDNLKVTLPSIGAVNYSKFLIMSGIALYILGQLKIKTKKKFTTRAES